MKSQRWTNVLPVMRYFYAIVWQYRRSHFILVTGNMLLRGLAPFINMVLPKFIIDELLSQQRVSAIAWYVGLLVGANFLVYLLSNMHDYLLAQAHVSLSMKFDELLGRKAMEMDFAYTENPQVLNQLEKAKTGMSWYSGGIEGLTDNLTAIVSNLFVLSGTLYIMGRLSPWLITFVLLLMALSVKVMAESQKKQVEFMKELVGINRRFSYYFGLLKNFKYGKDIRLYNATDMLMKRVDRYISEDWSIEQKRYQVDSRFTFYLTSINVLQQAILYGYLGLRVVARAITIGEFQMLVSAAGRFAGSISGILGQVIQIAKNADFMNDYKVFMEYPSVAATGTEKPQPAVAHVLEMRGVSFKYPGSEAYVLKDVSLAIPAGQKLSIVGPNGAGKTTCVKLLTRLYEPTEGVILLDGKDIRTYDYTEYMKLFAVIFQDFKLLAFTAHENVAIGTAPDATPIEAAINKVGLGAKFAGLPKGLDTPVYRSFDQDGVEFSGGESQKLAIARAIYKNAPIVILDEPTAALDPVAEYEIYTHFDSLVGGKTAIYISHRLSSCRFCDKIAVFANGRIVQYGSHAELSAVDGLYAQMWQAQAQWYLTETMPA